jgi:hypothetical protein
MGIPRKDPKARRCRSPEVMASALAARAQARTLSSSGSSMITGSIGSGIQTCAAAAYVRSNTARSRWRARRTAASLGYASTRASSSSKAGLAGKETIPIPARSITRRGGPFQIIPETKQFVSATTRTARSQRPDRTRATPSSTRVRASSSVRGSATPGSGSVMASSFWAALRRTASGSRSTIRPSSRRPASRSCWARLGEIGGELQDYLGHGTSRGDGTSRGEKTSQVSGMLPRRLTASPQETPALSLAQRRQ